MQNPAMTQPLIDIHLTVNGQTVNDQAPSAMSLLRFLRDRLELTGAKDACHEEHTGACTVLLDGQAAAACQLSLAQVNGRRVETIEGLAQGLTADAGGYARLDPLQRAFIEKGAVQCGYCTPGMIMTARALLAVHPNPTLDQVKQVLTENRNLCRCTGYVKIFEAIQQAAQWMGEPTAGGANAGGAIAGGAIAARTRADGKTAAPDAYEAGRALQESVAAEMVTGRHKFAGDLVMAGMLYGRILWSAYPKARILRLDVSGAEAMPGVTAVVTARDIPGKNQAGMVIRDQVALAVDHVHYVGDALASVFAETPEIAAAALDAIRVEYEPQPGVFSPDEAAAPGAPLVHEGRPGGNLLKHAEIVRGDVDQAFAECLASGGVVVEGRYTTPYIDHGFLELEAGLAYLEPDGTVVLQVPTQAAFEDRTQLCEILDRPAEKVRVMALLCGGAFGGKEDMVLQPHLALGAIKTGRPVKMALTRQESLRVHVKRHPAWMDYKLGADREGRVLALQAEITLDTGAYSSLGLDVLDNCVVFAAGPYYVPNLKITGKAWYTNNVPAGAMRGFGVNQVSFALEQHMDAAARQLGIDPFEFRLKNALDVGLPSAADHVMEAGVVSIKPTIQAARQAFEGQALPTGGATGGRGGGRRGVRIGVGVASAVKNIGFGHNVPEESGAVVELEASGRLLVRASQHEYGQGARMGLIKLASIELGVDPQDIDVTLPDTASTPPAGSTTASRQTVVTGNAVVKACRALKAELMGRAAEHLEQPGRAGVEPQRLQLRGSQVVDPLTGRSVELSELGERFSVGRTYASPPTEGMLPPGEPSRYGKPGFHSRVTHFCYAYNTQVAVVEVDPEAAEVRVLKVISAIDVGKLLNRDTVEGQIHGGAMMGLGYALSERFDVQDGVNLTDTLEKCGIPTAEMAPEIVPVIVEVPHPDGPLGVKGFAEAPSLATAPAIANAIYDALGVRITSLPADRAQLVRAMRDPVELRVVREA
jgi:CO/xanthine dehydrogenase Mo-binding subunit/aerobic-type carbon monoxide dehydrogenase small subunit (CoxS/CutS family)